ncbi:MAG: hypothetical protein OEM50_10480 [Gammaproteobacteria bacterium]|nr:hypothetical protein [Gammaproteobacteria bacterium]
MQGIRKDEHLIMWLPEPIYKSLPTIYGVMGILFILGVIYLGYDTPMGPIYLGLGLVSLLAAIGISVSRGKGGRNAGHSESDDSSNS